MKLFLQILSSSIIFLKCSTSNVRNTNGQTSFHDPTIEIKESRRFRHTFKETSVSVSETGLVAEQDFDIRYDNRLIWLQVHYKARPQITENQLKSYFKINTIWRGSEGHFGMGAIYNLLKENPDETVSRQIGGVKCRRLTRVWGSGISHDIASYHMTLIENPYFSEVLIIFLNVLPDLRDEDQPLDSERIDAALSQSNPRYAAFSEIETWLKEWRISDHP